MSNPEPPAGSAPAEAPTRLAVPADPSPFVPKTDPDAPKWKRSEFAMVAAGLNRGHIPVTTELLVEVLFQTGQVLTDPYAGDRIKMSAARVVTSVVKANQAAELLELKREKAELERRLAEQARPAGDLAGVDPAAAERALKALNEGVA